MGHLLATLGQGEEWVDSSCTGLDHDLRDSLCLPPWAISVAVFSIHPRFQGLLPTHQCDMTQSSHWVSRFLTITGLSSEHTFESL